MELPLAQRSEATLEYHVVSPEAAHDRFIVFLARVLALASIGSAVYPLAVAGARLSGARTVYSANYSTSFGLSAMPGVAMAFSVVGWLNGIAAALVVITAIGTFMRRNVMRQMLAASLSFLAVGLITDTVIRNWQLITLIAGNGGVVRSADKLNLAIGLLGWLGALIFPVAGGAVLWHPAFRRIGRTESDLLPSGAQALCFIAVVIASIGLLVRPLALLSFVGGASAEQSPLGMTILRDSNTLIVAWHYITRIILFGCSLSLLVGAIRMMRGDIAGRPFLVGQAVVAIIINTVETVLIVLLIWQLSDALRALGGAVEHLAFILPGLIFDIALCLYFTRKRTQTLLRRA